MKGKDHPAPLSDMQLRVKALESILVQKGFVNQETLDLLIDHYEHKVGPHIGARVVARAWSDPEFKSRLLDNGTTAIAELGIGGFSAGNLLVRENTPEVHNLVVCTLCSCYPWAVLGLPPVWYKSTPYRSRAVRKPRELLKEFNLHLDEKVAIHVWDSNAEMRYLVLPMRPDNSDHLDEAQLAQLVTRDTMIGTAIVDRVS